MMRKALCFDDVLLIPKYWSGGSRKEVDISTRVGGLPIDIPIISANMPSVSGLEMAYVMDDFGSLAILDRMGPIESQVEKIVEFRRTRKENSKIGGSIGIGQSALEDCKTLIEADVSLICIDVAHADQRDAFDTLQKVMQAYPKFPVIIGNYACHPKQGYDFKRMLNVSWKIGVGSGASCTTRIQTGCGLPTFQSLEMMRDAGSYTYKGGLIADGGMKNSGDIMKSLAVGASAVMIGSLLAGTVEAPGAVIKDDRTGNKYKIYRGNASATSKVEAGLREEFIEGAEMLVPIKGSARGVIQQLIDGIKSGFTYCGSRNLPELWEKAEFMQVSAATQRESQPHGLFK